MKPVYEEVPGWDESITKARTLEELPANAHRYVRALEELTGTRATNVSVGARREDTITISNPFTS
jgi:adenylosuccinate synthase